MIASGSSDKTLRVHEVDVQVRGMRVIVMFFICFLSISYDLTMILSHHTFGQCFCDQ
jgi:hypothetical protein